MILRHDDVTKRDRNCLKVICCGFYIEHPSHLCIVSLCKYIVISIMYIFEGVIDFQIFISILSQSWKDYMPA